MKTRIVYPRLWFDEKFVATTKEAKILFLYAVTNDRCGLTRYLHITDRQILFDTLLTPLELVNAKKELTDLHWLFFAENWIYQAHEAAYVEYEGRDRVIQAKDVELAKVPENIIEHFNLLITRYKPVLNHKPKNINPKSEIINTKSKTMDEGMKKIEEKRRELGISKKM